MESSERAGFVAHASARGRHLDIAHTTDQFQAALRRLELLGPYMGTYEQIPVLETPLLPQEGPSDRISAMMKIGQLGSGKGSEINRFAGTRGWTARGG